MLQTMTYMTTDRSNTTSSELDDANSTTVRCMPTQWSAMPTGETSHGATKEREILGLAERWRQIAERRHGSSWPHAEAHDVVVAVFGIMRGGSEELLHEAGERWGAVHQDTETLADRVQVLRQIMAHTWVGEPETIHRVLDGLIASSAMALSRRLEIDSRTDALTGMGNRRAFDESLDAAIASASRQHYSLSLVIADIDDMKYINDTKGHQAGDDTLVRLAHIVRTAVRKGDRVYRIGGDEFAIIMPYCSAQDARVIMGRTPMQGPPLFSWGVSSFPEDGVGVSSLVAAADAAMYRRKQRLIHRPRTAIRHLHRPSRQPA